LQRSSDQPGDDRPAQVTDSGAGIPDRLERLWAPYRSSYVTRSGRTDDPFVDLPSGSDEDGLIVARGAEVFCILNLYPYNPGHMMVIPYRRVASYEDLTDSETAEFADFTKKAVRVLRRVSHPDAVNIGMNLGKSSGGSVPGHLHQHIVPRWQGDANFMTVLDGTKVLVQALSETRELLSAAWRQCDEGGNGTEETE
jgi:ATP adenylyltransferase